MVRRVRGTFLVLALAPLVVLAGCADVTSDAGGARFAETSPTAITTTREASPRPSSTEPGPSAEPSPGATPSADPLTTTGTVTEVVDGDTITVDGQSVRLIGMDSHESGQCGYDEATAAMAAVVAGKVVTLTAVAGRDDRDRYGRLLRYVDVGGVDAGLHVIELGLAVARYDGRDGYGSHPRQEAYVAADAAAVDVTCATPEPVAAVPAPAPLVGSASGGSCDPSYPTVCIPPGPPDLDCGDISFRRFTVLAPDPHRFDGNHDGVGCESG